MFGRNPLGRRAALIGRALVSLTTSASTAQADLLGGVVGGVVGVVTTAVDTTTGLIGGADWGYSLTTTTMTQPEHAVAAYTMWSPGYTGKGVGVALIDTGVV